MLRTVFAAAALAAAFLLSACAHHAPMPRGKPFPINAPAHTEQP